MPTVSTFIRWQDKQQTHTHLSTISFVFIRSVQTSLTLPSHRHIFTALLNLLRTVINPRLSLCERLDQRCPANGPNTSPRAPCSSMSSTSATLGVYQPHGHYSSNYYLMQINTQKISLFYWYWIKWISRTLWSAAWRGTCSTWKTLWTRGSTASASLRGLPWRTWVCRVWRSGGFALAFSRYIIVIMVVLVCTYLACRHNYNNMHISAIAVATKNNWFLTNDQLRCWDCEAQYVPN